MNVTYYLGKRGGDGWSVDPIDPPQDNRFRPTSTPTPFLTPDLDKALQFSQVGLLPGAIAGGTNIFRRDNATGLRTLALATDSGRLMDEMADVGGPMLFGATPDLAHYTFTSNKQLLPDAAPGVSNVYELVGDRLRLVSRLPDGAVDAGGGELTNSLKVPAAKVLSLDGRRIFFNSPARNFPQGLYMRVDGTTTVPISVSQRVGDPPTAQPATFAGASEDGTVVYFASGAQLTDDATTSPSNGSLYRLDLASGELTNLTVLTDPSDTFPDVHRVFGISRDGSSAYFVSPNALTPDATPGTNQVYLADGSGIRLVAASSGFAGPTRFAISKNSRYFAFSTPDSLQGFDNLDPACVTDVETQNPPGACNEVYVYDSASSKLTCTSCVDSDGENLASVLGLPAKLTLSQYTGRAMLDDGTVFYTSKEALVPEDTNGKQDVYQWRDGVNTLISSGRGKEDSIFADASADGRDVFFFSYDRLVGIDKDDDRDLYDARVGGGIAAQNDVSERTPCDGDGCQGSLATPAALAPLGSAGLSGDGNAISDAPIIPKSTRVKLSKVQLFRDRFVRLRVQTPAAGRITISGQQIRAGKKRASKAATYLVTAGLTSSARRSLKRDGKLKIVLKVRFVPTSGKPSITNVSATLGA